MSKKISLIAVIIVVGLMSSLETMAQITPIEFIGIQGGTVNRIRNRTEKFMIPYVPHLNFEAQMMKIELVDGGTEEGFYKYNLETEELEKSNSEKILKPADIKSFIIQDGTGKTAQTFVNIQIIWPESEYLGFFEVVDEKFSAVIKYYLEFKPADYNPTMDIGNPNDRVEQEIEMYYRIINKWYLLPDSKKKFVEALSEFKASGDIKKFMKKNKFKMTDPKRVAKVVDFVANN